MKLINRKHLTIHNGRLSGLPPDIFPNILMTLREKLLKLAGNKKTGHEVRSGGGDRIRTGVQTYSTKAFYMFIPALIVGK